MWEYRYVNVDTGGGLIFDNYAARHREIIDAAAREGWRFVGTVPTLFTSQGGVKALDLVFECEVPDRENE